MTTPTRFAAYAFIAAGIFFAGHMVDRQPVPVASSASLKPVLYYTCPMHPQYKSDHAGTCPVCGMSLVTMSAGRVGIDSDSLTPDPPGMVRISAAKQQLIGVHVDEVKRSPATQLLRVPGRIAVDEQRLYRITATVDGWIQELGQNSAGTFVKKDQILSSFYAENLNSIAPTAVRSLQLGTLSDRGDAITGISRFLLAIDALRNIGMGEIQIDEIKKTHIAPATVHIYAPISGYVIARNIFPKQRFDKGLEMYRIADIGHVWVITDIFEKDRDFVRPGATAAIRYQGREFPARMSNVLLQFDTQSRTLKTRFELDNPGYVLLPDMFVDVELHVDKPAAVTVPADAIIDSGRQKTVYVECTSGMFEPRIVETGWRLGDRVQITRGLEQGERIVVSGNFLIDSESRIQLAAADRAPMAKKVTSARDPVCGMEVNVRAADTPQVRSGSQIYYFCSAKCKRDFEANPGQYVREMAAQDTKLDLP